MIIQKFIGSLAIATLLVGGTSALVGCEQKTPAEKAGDNVKDATHDAADATRDAGHKAADHRARRDELIAGDPIR